MKKSIFGIIVLLLLSNTLFAQSYAEPQPRLYLTSSDIIRAKNQVRDCPELAKSYNTMLNLQERNAAGWRKSLPEKQGGYTTSELLEIGSKANVRPDYLSDAAAYVFNPSDKAAQIIREKMLVEIGISQSQGAWRELGIHEGERAHRFLSAYDLIESTGMLSQSEKDIIVKEFRKIGLFLQAWTLESPISPVFQGQTYCFNIKYFPACMIGVIGMYFPEIPESKEWIEIAQHDVERYFFTENFLDGAYGEGSVHYFHPTMDGVIQYIKASQNLGYCDLMKNLAFRRAFSEAFKWRMNLTAPDGRKMAIGDAHRSSVGANLIEAAGSMLNDGELTWCSRTIIDRANNGELIGAYNLLEIDMSDKPVKPTHLYKNYIWSGYTFLRSGWESDDNFLAFKYGPTYAGRREIEQYAVIPGHANEDCMELELHYKGIPMLVDGGYRGQYAKYETYGGYWKATIAHNTVGIGNQYGYSRLDGKFEEHLKTHGKEFRYEKEQNNIGRKDYRLKAFGDVKSAAIISAKAKTYDFVTHQRSIVWFRNSSISIVYDQMESRDEQPYEWYLNPVGKLISKTKNSYTFGSDATKLSVHTIIPAVSEVDILSQGDKNVPSYYYPLQSKFSQEAGWDGPDARWRNITLFVERVKSKKADFFHILLPTSGKESYSVENMGDKGRNIKTAQGNILVSAKNNSDKTINIDGAFGVVAISDTGVDNFAMHQGLSMQYKGMPLVKSELHSARWGDLYSADVTALVDVNNRLASFSLNPNPWMETLVNHPPKIEEGKEPAIPLEVKITFRTDKSPKRIILLRSDTQMPEAEDKTFDSKSEMIGLFTDKQVFGTIESRSWRKELPFEFDSETGMTSIILGTGFNQIKWE